MTELATLKRKRGCVKSSLASFNKYLDTLQDGLSELQEIELQDRLDNLLDILDKFNSIHSEIEMLCDLESLDAQGLERDNFLERFYAATSRAKLLLKQKDSASSHNSAPISNSKFQPTAIKLPDISLPKFNGNFEDWLEFRDIFDSLIHQNEALSNIQKFFYLRGALEGSAAASIKQVQYNAANYTVAWTTLCERFNNTKKLLHNHLGALCFFNTIQKGSHDSLQHLADNISRHLGAIEQLGQSVSNWDCLLIFWVSQKLDNATLCDWERQTRNTSASPTIDEFLQFLRERANFADTLDYKRNQNVDKGNLKIAKDSVKSSTKQHSRALVSSHYTCSFCKGDHSIYICEGFLKLSIVERNQFVRKTPSICVNCLREGHAASKCKIGSCRKCKQRHNTLLHANDTEGRSETPAQESITSNSMNSGVLRGIHAQVVLSTANLLVLDQHNKYQKVRALLDCGSQTSFISEGVLRRLGLSKQNTNLTIFGISNLQSHINKKCKVTLKSAQSDFKTEITCYVLPIISNIMPSLKFDIDQLHIPEGIPLADPQFNIPGTIDILIGADLFWHLLGSDKIILGKNLPVLQDTKLGWVVSGGLGLYEPKRTTCNLSTNQELLQAMSKFWEIEELSNIKSLSQDELSCEDNFAQTTMRQPDGRFVVNMPLKQDPNNLGESRSQAENRFYALERRLLRNERLRTLYQDFMSEYESLGHMSLINNASESHLQYFMPHHGVLKESSLTTKLRVVFDASAPTSNGLSLNNIQLIGPVLQDDLLSIILRFRQYRYVITADVAKMYRQVLINQSQRRLQRILWRSSPNQPLRTYELNTVTYGQAAASYLAIKCLFSLADAIEQTRPNIARIIKHDFYVDDMLTGSNSLEEAQQICREVSEILKGGCFELRKWCSNDQDVLSGIERSNLIFDILSFSSNDKTQALGLTWACQNDTLLYNIDTSSFSCKATKRSVLSTIARIFDPLGLVSPCTILSKILMQKLWSAGISWDDPLPDKLNTMWTKFQSEIPLLNELSIGRHAIVNNATQIELHGFADSSESAYGACIYLRSLDVNNDVQVSLLCAKSKVAPLQTISVPRLELCGALLLSRLVDKATKSLNINFNKRILWSDSTIALAWIKTSPNLLKTFTGNRVSKIQSLTMDCEWHYIPTAENPADIVSRGLYPSQILDSNLWWKGPTWLSFDTNEWPREQPVVNSLPDLRTQSLLVRKNANLLDFTFDKFSKYNKLINVTAYMLRFKHNCCKNKNDRETGQLKLYEVRSANKILIRICQYQSFSSETEDLLNGKPLNHKNRLLSLTPFLDKDNIMRVGGRLKYSDYPFDKKHPILLHSDHHFTKLLFEEEHKRLLHAGPQLLLFTIRNTYWPISGRNLARATVRRCIRCFKFNAATIQPIMGNLPNARVTPSSPFSITGVDYAGPFLIKDRKGRGNKTSKCYIALFVCFATKAIHIEVVSGLSSELFMQALRRFVARRGKPTTIYSDNGTNFVGVQREFSKLLSSQSLKDDLDEFTSLQSINWQFIPPYSPHFGGLWEAGVKSCKHHLKRVLSSTPLVFEELYTLCTQIEGILNSRPLSPINNDPNDLSPLTPAHFIIGKPIIAAPDEDVVDVNINRLNRYQLVQQMTQHFWQRWKTEYISELQRRGRWRETMGTLTEGTLVLIKEDNTKPTQWQMGRIIALHPGSDNVSRVATIKTSTGTIKRGFQKICPLPLSY